MTKRLSLTSWTSIRTWFRKISLSTKLLLYWLPIMLQRVLRILRKPLPPVNLGPSTLTRLDSRGLPNLPTNPSSLLKHLPKYYPRTQTVEMLARAQAAAIVTFNLLRRISQIEVNPKIGVSMAHSSGVRRRIFTYTSKVERRVMDLRLVTPCHCLSGSTHASD